MDSLQNQPPAEASLHFLDYWRIIRIRKAIIITVFLITSIIATAVTFILPVSYSSTAQINIEVDDVSDVAKMSGGGGTESGYNPYFLQTQLEILKGPTVLNKVVDALQLTTVWAKKYGTETVKPSDAVEYLNHMTSLDPVRNTTLIGIKVYSNDKNEAAAIANAIAKAYLEYRVERHTSKSMGGIKVLEDQYKSEDQQIQTIRSNVDKLRKDLAILTPTRSPLCQPPR